VQEVFECERNEGELGTNAGVIGGRFFVDVGGRRDD
jgi:hypothetical protein